MSLQLVFFGEYHVSIASQSIRRFRSEKARALLAYLAVESEHFHSREKLASLLWSEYEEKEARNNLRVTLYRLRSLFAEKSDISVDSFFYTDRRSIKARPDVDILSLDTDLFLYHYRAAIRCFSELGGPTSFDYERHLELARDSYQGEFLAGLSPSLSPEFDDWAVTKRNEFRQAYIDVLDRLVCLFMRKHDHDLAIRYAKEVIQIEPWRESAHRLIMQALAHLGKRTAALAQFDACCLALEEALDVSPSETTFQLYLEIKRSDETLLMRQTNKVLGNLSQQKSQFLHDDEVSHQLASCLREIDSRLVVLMGEDGRMKTRLALDVGELLLQQFCGGVWVMPPLSEQQLLNDDIESYAQLVVDEMNLDDDGFDSPLDCLVTSVTFRTLLIFDALVDPSPYMLQFLHILIERNPHVKLLCNTTRPVFISNEQLWILHQGVLIKPETVPIPQTLRENQTVKTSLLQYAAMSYTTFSQQLGQQLDELSATAVLLQRDLEHPPVSLPVLQMTV